ncbi:type 4a pilus biogenesis protein PilO [Paractinoplanes toevensis]|uniref:Uncharacterized protein n=1 Tax=Paractinoplanes toevensis TaxID=571911 RepID=A0A919W2B0_9ACTN|nr:type 4a pilus biogenesis protein PilO [Actinoplanes toevensis]GIM89330.1 hypothetical protein Ato02nite_011230 [Actinoplanes toevensis]
MGGTQNSNRLWLLGGVAAVVIIVAATFLLAIKPVYAEKSDLLGQADDQDVQLVVLRHDLNELKAKDAKLATYQAQLTAKEAALPEKYDMTGYLRLLQTSESAVTIKIDSVGISAPQAVTGTAGVYSVPIGLSVKGTAANISKVLKRLQTVQSRAVLITSVSVTGSDDAATASIVLSAFCRKSDACQVAS